MAKPPRRRLSSSSQKEAEDAANQGSATVFFETEGMSDTENLTKLLKPASTQPEVPITSPKGGDLPDGSLADLLRIPVAAPAVIPPEPEPEPKAEMRSPAVVVPTVAAVSVWVRAKQWLRDHRRVLLAIPLALVAMGIFAWWNFQSVVRETPGEGAKRPPPRRDAGIRFENMDVERVKVLGEGDRQAMLAAIGTAVQQGNWQRILNLGGKALEAGFGDPGELWLRLGEAHVALSQEGEAHVAFHHAVANGARDLPAMLFLARRALAAGNAASALPVLRDAAAAFPDEKDIFLLTGQACLALERETEALAAWRRLAEVDFPDELLPIHLALLRRHGDTAETFRFALFTARKNQQAKDYLMAAENAPDVDQRLFVLAEAAGLFRDNPDRDKIALLRAESMLDAGKRNEAAMLLKSLRLEDQPAESLPRLAELTVRAGSIDALRDVWMEIRRLYPNDVALHERLSTMLVETGGRQQVRSLYGRWMADEPTQPLPRYIFALGLDDDELALSTLEEALSRNPSFAEATFAAGELARRLGDHDRAARHYQAAMRLRPGHRETRYGLAMNNIARDGADALRAYESFLVGQRVPRHEALPQLLALAQQLPGPAAAEIVLAEMATIPELADLHRRQRVRTRLIYQQVTDQDFAGGYPRELREYHILHLLGQGRLGEVLMMPTPKEDFPEFWKVFLCWRDDIDIWRDNARLLLAKHPGDPLVEGAVGLWLRTLAPEAAAALLPRVPTEKRPVLVLMIAERHRHDKNRTRARIEYLRALRIAGVSPYVQCIRWFSEH
jgi:tetratricopeptide (TPR) repeat protein